MAEEKLTEERNDSSRRRFLKNAGITVAGIAVASSGLGILLSGCETSDNASQAAVVVPEWPWPYTKIDPDVAAERAYLSYQESG